MTTNTQSPAPGVAAEETIERLMNLAWTMAKNVNKPNADAALNAVNAFEDALRTALQASAAAVPNAWIPSLRDLNTCPPEVHDYGNGYQYGYTWGWNDCIRRIQEERARTPAPGMATDPISLALCEASHLVLRVGQSYTFSAVGDCKECAELAASAKEAYGTADSVPGAQHVCKSAPGMAGGVGAVPNMRGIHVLRGAIAMLREEAVYRDDEGEDTDALEELLAAITASGRDAS